MSLSIRTNISSLIAINNLSESQNKMRTSVERISTGRRVNRASDDAAGLSISSRMQSDNISNKQVMRNINDGIGLIQTLETSIEEIQNSVVRMRELGVQALSQGSSNGTDGFMEQRFLIMEESMKEIDTINQITAKNNFNRINLLNSTDTSFVLQVGLENSSDHRLQINMVSMSTSIGALGLATFVATLTDVIANRTGTYFSAFLDVLDNAFTRLGEKRSRLGALQNRLDSALSNAMTYGTNMSTTQSRIIDADYASEASLMTSATIQNQAGVAALAQSNQIPRTLISLLS